MIDLMLLGLWSLLWMLGGVWVARAAFRIERGELLLAGIGVGLAAENLLANLFGRFLPLPAAFWIAAASTLLLGLALALRDGPRALLSLSWVKSGGGIRNFKQFLAGTRDIWGTLLALVGIVLLSFGLGRGLGIFDDFVQLPTISLLAAGNIPPRFALDPRAPYDYHYFILLFSAQAVRIGNLHPWTALDLARGLTSGLAVALMFHWTRRLTHSPAAGLLGAAFVLFASGTRWLLLFLPDFLLKPLAAGMQLLGSGAASGSDLGGALSGAWLVEGAGPIPFPYAFANGVFPPGVLTQFVANGLTEIAFVLVLLLTFKRWRGAWRGALASALVLSAGMLLSEGGVALEIGGWGLAALITALRLRSLRLPPTLWAWLAAAAGGHLLGAWQWGALAGISARAQGLAPAASYHSIGFQAVFPPNLVSTHLGVLSLTNPGQFLAALAELGPLVLAFPLLVAWGWKAVRIGRWYEAALVGEALLSVGMLFVNYTGSEGVRITARLYRFMFVLSIFAVPLGWNWTVRRPGWRRWAAGAAAGMALVSGLVMFALELPVLQRPVYTYFIYEMDVRISDRFWNGLEKDALVFDAVPYRAPLVLGRFTNSSTTWYALRPEWKLLFQQPYPDRLRAGGYSYAYLDDAYFQGLPAEVQRAWGAGCAKKLDEAANGEQWRRLYDIRGCKP